jgi:hypothetical protein
VKQIGSILAVVILSTNAWAEDQHEAFSAWFYPENAPEIALQGVIAFDETTNEMSVPWAWLVQEDGITLLQLTDGGLNLPHVRIRPFEGNETTMLLEVDPIGFREEEQPVGESLVLLEKQPSTTSWVWNGFAFMQSEIDEGIYQMGVLGVPTMTDPCGAPPTNANDTTHIYRLSEKEVLIFVLNEDGTVTILVYRQDQNGCWKWSRNPDSHEPPPLPDFSFPDILPFVIDAYASYMINGGQITVPPEPI